MNIKILQIKKGLDTSYYFRGWSTAEKWGFSFNHYETVWSSEMDSDINLDDIFRTFNRVTDEDCDYLESIGFRGHSLSCSDIIVLDNKEVYYVDDFGFKKLEGLQVENYLKSLS